MPAWLTIMIPAVPWWFASLVANVCICRIEYVNRVTEASGFYQVLPMTWWLIVLSQWGLWNAWSAAPSFMVAWAWFTLMNGVMRLASAQWAVGEPPSWMAIGGTALMFAAAYMIKTGSVASS